MTKENSKRLYEHYIKNGNEKAAANMLAKYPNFATTASKKVVKKEEEKAKE